MGAAPSNAGERPLKLLRLGRDGPRLLWLHGNDLCGESYLPLGHALAARGLRVDLVTLPGFHREAPLPTPSWGALTDAVIAAVDPADPPAVVAGHSMGGLLSLLVAARRPPWLRALALLEPAIFPGRAVARAAARKYLKRVVLGSRDEVDNWNGGMRRMADPRRYPREALDVYREVRGTSDVSTGRALFESLPALYPLPFSDVEVPCLLVRGAATGLFGRVMCAWLGRRLGVAPVTIPGAAHWLAHEADDAVADVVGAFTRRTVGAG